MLIAVVPFVVAVIGLLMYVLASNNKVSTAGLVLFAAGVLVICFALAGHTIKIG